VDIFFDLVLVVYQFLPQHDKLVRYAGRI